MRSQSRCWTASRHDEHPLPNASQPDSQRGAVNPGCVAQSGGKTMYELDKNEEDFGSISCNELEKGNNSPCTWCGSTTFRIIGNKGGALGVDLYCSHCGSHGIPRMAAVARISFSDQAI
jgi:hypothetical protein